MKILHSADWHLDSPILGRTPAQTEFIKAALLRLPGLVAAAARTQGCQLMLLSGDLFDGPASRESIAAVRSALEDAAIPVFIAPGNHDYLSPSSPWLREVWPENVHIFTGGTLESVALPQLDCRVWGAAFSAPEAAGLLSGFRAQGDERYQLGVVHGDPTQASSPYCPITAAEVQASGLDYLALGHIHKGGELRAGKTLCAWPGCPMGRGFDELDAKGVLIVTLEPDSCRTRFLPLDTPRFFDLECPGDPDPRQALAGILPALGSQDFYRVTFTGESDPLDLPALSAGFPQFPNLLLRDRTVPPMDLWASADADTLEGAYFRLLRQQLEGADEATARRILLAAKLSKQLLEGQEVRLP